MSHICPRCASELVSIDNSPALFCAHCGLPQLRISEDAYASPGVPESGESQAGRNVALDMPRALRVAAIAGLAGVLPASFLPGALVAGGVGGLALLLTPMLAFAAVHAYGRGRPYDALSSSAGTRVGALLGLWMGCLIAAVTGVAGFVLRYGYHSRVIEQTIDEAAKQLPVQLRAAGGVPQELTRFLQTAEFRAGSFIFGHVFTLVLLVATGSICGWMAAALLRSRRRASVG